VDAVCGPSEEILQREVRLALTAIKVGKAAESSEVVSEMLLSRG
jgi:hypothetical protein